MKMYQLPFLSRALSIAIFSCLFATVSLNAAAPVITSSLAETYAVNVPIPTYTITASNGPTSFGAISLPPGLSRSGAVISGTPSKVGSFDVTLFVQNADGFDQETLELTVTGAEIESSLSETATVGQPYAYQIMANNGPNTFNVIGLGDFLGLSLDPSTGLISGTPTEPYSGDIIIQAINGASVATALLVLDVSGVPPAEPTVTIDSPLNGADYTDGDPITLEITADDADGFLTQVEVFSGTIFLGTAQFIGVDQYSFQANTGTDGLEVGTQNLTVQATDNVGNVVTSDSVVVDVLPKATGAAPDVSITSPTAGDSIKSGETLEITVDATDADIDGFITSVEVFNNDALLGLANPTGAAGKFLLSYRTSAADLGNLNLQARAVDNQGNVGYSAVIAYSVVQGVVPEVSIDSPADGEVFLINTQIPLAITADDGDDSIVSVEVFSNGTSVGFASSAGGDQYQFTLTETGEAGLQRLTAVATDELDNSTTSEEVNILLSSGASPVTVLNTVNGSAPAVAPAVDEVDLGSIVTLGISASDSDGNVTQVEVFNGANSIGFAVLVGVDTYRFDYQASSPGLLNLQVRASDDLGNIGFSDLVEVSVITGAIPTVTITSPTAGDSIKSGETLEITVDATDADIDGFITSVEVFNNDALLGLANPTGAAGKFLLSYRTSAADLGNLNLQARAVDNQGNVGYSAVIAYSVVQGVVPEVSIDSPADGEVFLINTQIPLAITADDGDDSIVSVEVFSNGTSVGFASSAGGDQYQFTLTETGEAGLQRLTAVATDELDNSTTSEEVNILLSSGASPVTVLNTVNGSAPAVAPAVDEVDLGSIVTLGISASDSDGNVTQVEVFNGANSIGFAVLVGVDTYRFDYQASSPGLLNLQVRASDDLGNIGFSDLVEVSVITGAIPTVTITSPTAGDSIKSGETLEITVDATDADIDGFITSVEVFNNDALLGLANPTGAAGKFLLSYRTSAADLGNLNLQARAVDNQGNVGYSAVIAYSVVQGVVPEVSIDSPADGEVFLINTQIPLAITADDGDDSIVSVEVFSNGTSVGFASSAGGDQYQFTLTETGEAGLQRLTAVATDELDNSTTSEEVNILLSSGASPVTVLNTVNGSAPAVAPAVDEVDLGSIVTLGISASDSDGNVTQVEVFNGANSIGFAVLVGVDTYRFDYQASSPGLLNLQVRASDDLGNIGFSDLVEVSVITGAIPTVTITSPTAGDSIKSGETLEITVDATDADIDGFITSVEVFNNDALLGLANPTGAAGKFLLSYRTSAADLGNLNLQARAVDNQGNVGYSAVIAYSVVQGVVPEVSIDSPADGEVFLINTQIPLAITADDGDDSIVSVEVFSNGTSVGFASSAGGDQYQFTLTETGEAGLQRLTAVATDELDNSTTSEEVNILLSSGASPVTVLNTVNGSAPAVAPAVDEVDLGSIVTLGISASDSDGNVTQVEVFNGANSIGFAVLVGVDTYRFDYQASSPGLLNLQVRASDDLGNIGFSDLVEVSVITGAIPTVTITSPTAGDSIKSGETLEITVDATDADIDGFITSVEVFNNDALLGLANPTGAAGKFLLSYRTSAADLGNLNLQARAVDNQGNVGYSAVIAYSVVQGVVPEVSIDSPADGEVFLINTQIPLAITADDGDDSIVSVEVFSNGTSVGFASSAGGDQYQFTLTETGEAGLQRLTAVATDELDNSTTSEEVNILLSSGASPVTVLNTVNGSAPAVAPAVDEVDLGSIVTLGISASDSDGNVTQVEVFNGANSIGFAVLVGVDTYRFDYQASSPGLLNLQVRASDDLGNIGFSDLVEVSVITGAIPTVTITSPTAGDSIKSGETLEITVDATDADIDGFITSVEVFNNDALLGLANPTGAAGKFLLSYRTSAADLGNLNLQARAVDNQGNVGYSAVIAYSVVQGVVPEVSIDSPADGEVFLINTQIPLAITADDGDDSIVSVEVFSNGTSVGFASSAGGDQYQFTLTETGEAGLQRLTAVATDELDNSTTSEEVNILLSSGASPVTVLNTVNGSAPAVAPAVDEVDLGSIVTLGISASDSDGNVTQVEVFNGANSIGFAVLVGVDTYRFDYQASSPGLLNLQVRASDDLGNIGFSDLVEVSVITGAIPTVTITSPTAGDSIKSGETLEITVDATDADIDGFITSVEVFNNDALLGLANPTGAAGKFLLSYRTSAADLGNLNLQARAVDNQGNVGYSAVIAYSVVQGVVPEVSIDSPADGEVFLINTQIPLAITADDGDDSIVSVEVFSNGTSVGFASSAGGDQYQFTLTETGEAGLQRLTAVATDELDNSTTSEEVNILLSSGASPVTVLNTVNGSAPAVAPAVDEVDLGSIVTLGISASDSDGNVTQVEVFNGANSIGFAVLVGVDTYRFDYQASSPGLLNLQVRASDDLGNIGFSDLVEVSVITGAIPTVTITSPTAGDSIKSGETLEITVDATDADIDGFITSVEVFNNDALLGLANPTGAAGKFLLSYRTSAADLGNLNLQARAVDNQGNVGYSAVIAYSVVQGAVPEVSIDSPAADASYTQGDSIALEITADAADGFVTSVEIFNGEVLLGTALKISGDQYRYTIDTATAEIASGTLTLSARATDNLGNAGFAWLSVDLAPIVFSVSFTDPTSNLLELTAAEGEFFETSYTFTVEVGGIATGSLQSLVWQLDSEDPVEQADLGTGLSFSQSFTVDTCATLLVTATNTDGVAVTTRVAIGTSFPDPVSDSSDFIDYIYNQIRGTAPSDTEKNAALADLVNNGDTAATRAELTAGLYPDGQLLGSRQTLVALVYKTVTGQWPTAAEMESALLLLETDPEALVSQTVEAQSGSINSGGSETFTFNYTAGTEVSIRVSPDGSNGNPLSDPTLTVNDPNGTFVGFSDDNFVLGSSNPLDAVLTFTATQSGDYTATVRGFSSFQSGDFAIVSTSVSTESNNDLLLARVLVKSLQDSYNGANGFLADTDVANPALSPQFVAQLYRNKHDVGITNFNSNTLGARLTGTDEDMGGGYILPGYSGDVLSFVAAFALDTDLAVGSIASISTPDGFSYTSELFYGRPNNPLSVWNAAASDLQDEFNITEAVSDLLPNLENPDLTEYDGMTLEVALATIFTDPAFSAQFPGSCVATPLASPVEAAVASALLVAGEQKLTGLTDDADGDGNNNLVEYALGGDPVDASNGLAVQVSIDAPALPADPETFVLTYVQLENLPAGMSIIVECSADLTQWVPVDASSSVLAADQSGVPVGYERVEYRVSLDPVAQPCMFARIVVQID